ncbi:hypothetical protein Fmac_032898 [Flemingia macrophylla]|uniref:Uncharacterized protein n=1 Tax=Flemingia macrophylla TaxID=520843 RepID=A0ABD1L681_9FABA
MMPLSLEEFLMWLQIHLLKLENLEGKLDALMNLVTQLVANQKPGSVARVCGIRSSNEQHTSVCPSSQQSGGGVQDLATRYIDETRNLEGKLVALVNLVNQLAANQKPALVVRVCGIRSSNDNHTDHHNSRDKALDREYGSLLLALEGKIDALVNLVTRLGCESKHCLSCRVYGIRFPMTTILVFVLLGKNLEWMSILRLMLQTPIADHHNSRDKALDKDLTPNSHQFSPRNDVIVIGGVHEVATRYICFETRKAGRQARCSCELGDSASYESKLPPLQESASSVLPMTTILVSVILEAIWNQHSSRDKEFDREEAPNSLQFSARNDAIVIRGVHDVATDTSDETRKLEGKLDALVNLKAGWQPRCSCELGDSARLRIEALPLLQESAVSVLPMTTILVSVLLRSNLELMSILRIMRQTPIVDHHSSRHKALDREDGSQLLALRIRSLPLLQECAASVLLMTTILVSVLLRSNQEWISIPRLIFANTYSRLPLRARDKALDREEALNSLQFGARNDAIVIGGVHDMATDSSALKTRKAGRKARCSCDLGDSAICDRSLPLLQESVASILPMNTILVSVLLRSNLEWMSILRLMLQNL